MDKDWLYMIPGIDYEEMLALKEATRGFSPQQQKEFLMLYNGRRKDPQTILIFTLIGFFGVAGLQRFVTREVGLGVLYFFTLGLCFIGTILDAVNYRQITLHYNKLMIEESAEMVRMIS